MPLTASKMMGDMKKKAASAASAAKGKLGLGKDGVTGSSSTSASREETLRQMADMGVPRAEAAAALEATGGDVEAAIALLYADDGPANTGVADAGLLPGRRAIVVGLQRSPELNGIVVTLEHFDPGEGRWRVRFPDGGARALRPTNLDALKVVTTASGRESQDGFELPVEALAIKSGVWVKIHGLRSEAGKSLNGKIGQVIELDSASGRILVDVNDEAKLLKAENLKKASTSDEVQAQMKASMRSAKASAQDMKRKAEAFMKAGTTSKKDDATAPLTESRMYSQSSTWPPPQEPQPSSGPADVGSAASRAEARRATAEAAERRLAEARARNAGTMDDWRRMRSGQPAGAPARSTGAARATEHPPPSRDVNEIEIMRRAQESQLRASQTQTPDLLAMDEDEDLQAALAMSLESVGKGDTAKTSTEDDTVNDAPSPSLTTAPAAAAVGAVAEAAAKGPQAPRGSDPAIRGEGVDTAVAEDPELFELMLQQTMAEEELELQMALAESLTAERKALEEVTVDPNSAACCAATGDELEQQLAQRKEKEQRVAEERVALEGRVASLREQVARRESGCCERPEESDEEDIGVADTMGSSSAAVGVAESSSLAAEDIGDEGGAAAASRGEKPVVPADAAVPTSATDNGAEQEFEPREEGLEVGESAPATDGVKGASEPADDVSGQDRELGLPEPAGANTDGSSPSAEAPEAAASPTDDAGGATMAAEPLPSPSTPAGSAAPAAGGAASEAPPQPMETSAPASPAAACNDDVVEPAAAGEPATATDGAAEAPQHSAASAGPSHADS